MHNKSIWGRILLSGASLAALGALTPAFAQDEPEASEEIVVTATGRAAALQDVPVAVTAIGAETLENSGVEDLRDITQLAPSLRFATGESQSAGTAASIRGIGTGSNNPGFESAVGIFVDGVYRARPGSAISDLPEVERVEVLRGPQGTLFGRNTSAGAISVVTAGPESEPGMWLEGRYNLDDLEGGGLKAGVNVPLGDTVAFRLDGSVQARDGYITDLISGDDLSDRERWSARGQMLWDISPNASLRVIVDAAEADEVCCSGVPFIYGSTQGVVNFVAGPAASPPIDPESFTTTVTPGRSFRDVSEEHGISGELNWDLGFANLTSITGYRNWQAERDQDTDFNLIDIAYRDGLTTEFDNFTQEIRLQGESGRLNWLVGMFYGDEQLDTTDRIRIGAQANQYTSFATLFGAGGELYDFTAAPSIYQVAVSFLPPADQAAALIAVNSVNGGYLLPNATGSGQQDDAWSVETQSLSLFTHNEFSLTDALVLTVGARFNHETKDLSADLFATGDSCGSIQAMELATDAAVSGPGGIVSFLETFAGGAFSSTQNFACNPAVNTIANGTWTGDTEENEWSGTTSLAYHMTENVMLYAGYSRGYKAGGFNVDRQGFSMRPSTTSAAALNTGQLQFDPEFTDSFELGLRSTVFGSTNLNVTAFYTQLHDFQLNAFNGFNFITRNVPEVISQGVEFDFRTRLTDQLSIEGGVNYTDAYYDSSVIFNPLDGSGVVSGDPLTFAPEWSASGAVSYVQPLGGNLLALFYLDARFSGEYRTQTLGRNPNGATDQGEYTTFNGRIGIGPEDERWSVEFWGRNLTDELYLHGAFAAPLQNSIYVFPSEPQTYGVTLRARY